MKKIRKQIILLSLILLFIILACNAASATEISNNSTTGLSSNNSTDQPSNAVISGQVLKCSNGDPFPGVTVTASKDGTTLASTTTKEDGAYDLSFISNAKVFTATASYPGHKSSSKEVMVITGQNDTFYGNVNFQLGWMVYVDPVNGDDGNDGSFNHPYKTIKKAIETVDPNGYIELFDGTYTGIDNRNLIINKNLTIESEYDHNAVTIDAYGLSNIFTIDNSANDVKVTVQRVTLTGGSADDGGAINFGTNIHHSAYLYLNYCTFTNNHATYSGGALYCGVGTVYLFNCTFTGNSATSGGAIDNFWGSVFATKCTFTNNNARSGGAISSDNTMTITGCTFTGNRADTTVTDGDGGAIYNGGTCSVTGSAFLNNVAQSGAIYNSGDLTVTTSVFTGNGATGYGGAIENYGTLCNVYNCTFTGNYASDGGAFYNHKPNCKITGSTFISNTVTGNGGAIGNGDSGATCTINFNRIINNTRTDVYSWVTGVNATNNWWGTNFQGTNPQNAGRVNSNVNANPWIVLSVSATPNTINNGATSTITADFNHINGGGDLIGGHIPDGSMILNVPWGSFTSSGTTHSVTLNTANGAITSITFYANGGAAPSSPVKVTASADGYTTDTDSAFININKLTNLVITKTGTTTVLAGNPITYTITVTNNGIDSADNVQIYDTFPAGVSGVNWAAIYTGGATGPSSGTGNLNLNLGTLPAGGSCTITATGTVLSSTPASTISNTATVTTTTLETINTDDSTTATTTVDTQSDVGVTEIVDKPRPNVGDTVTFTVTARNNGPSDATNIQIQDLMPLDFINVVITPLKGTYDAGIWTLNLTSGEEANLTLSGKVTAIMAGKNTTNTASIQGSTDSANATIYVPKSDIYIQISSDKNNPKVGETFTIIYKLGNNGPDAADNVKITIPLPKGFEISQITGDGKWTYNAATKTIIWTFANVPVGDPYLYISGKFLGPGTYVFNSSIFSNTYSLNTEGVTPITIDAASNTTKTIGMQETVNAASNTTKTIRMQETGLPLAGLVLAVLMVIVGLVPRRK